MDDFESLQHQCTVDDTRNTMEKHSPCPPGEYCPCNVFQMLVWMFITWGTY